MWLVNKYSRNVNTKNIKCVGASDGRDAFQGDSNGPILDRERQVLVGLVSWGNSCGDDGYPGVYSRISL